MDQTVELYCGAEKPFSLIAEALGYAAFTVDVDPENRPSLTGDVTEALAKQIPASPLIVICWRSSSVATEICLYQLIESGGR